MLFHLLQFRSHRYEERAGISDQATQAAETWCTCTYWWSLALLALQLLKPLEDEVFGTMNV